MSKMDTNTPFTGDYSKDVYTVLEIISKHQDVINNTFQEFFELYPLTEVEIIKPSPKQQIINMNDLKTSLSKCKVEGNVLFLPPMSEGPLSNYSEVRTALLNAGAKYKRNTFVFPNEAQPYIDRLVGGENVNIKKEFQFFATPPDIAEWLVELADLQLYHSVLEPSAGQGAITDAICKRHPSKVRKTNITCFEIMDENRDVLEKKGYHVIEFDFLTTEADWTNSFDRIIANPPFSKNQDIHHIRKMYECLKPGGRIVTVASKHWQQSSYRKEREFQNWLDEIGAEIHEIEAGAFKESGTMVSSCVIVINKVASPSYQQTEEQLTFIDDEAN